MPPVIGFAGYAGSGKSTAAAYLAGAHGYQQVDFADPLRAALMTLNPIVGVGFGTRYAEVVDDFGYNVAKEAWPEVRRLLQVLGTDVIRALDPDLWVKLWLRTTQDRRPVVAADVRFRNEIAAVHDAGGEVWWVARPGCGPGYHSSEHTISPADCDRTIANTGDISGLHELVDLHLTMAAA